MARSGPPTCNALKVASVEDERQSRKSGVWSSLKELRLLAVKEAAHDGEKVTVLNVLGDHLLSGGADGVSLLDGTHLASTCKVRHKRTCMDTCSVSLFCCDFNTALQHMPVWRVYRESKGRTNEVDQLQNMGTNRQNGAYTRRLGTYSNSNDSPFFGGIRLQVSAVI